VSSQGVQRTGGKERGLGHRTLGTGIRSPSKNWKATKADIGLRVADEGGVGRLGGEGGKGGI